MSLIHRILDELKAIETKLIAALPGDHHDAVRATVDQASARVLLHGESAVSAGVLDDEALKQRIAARNAQVVDSAQTDEDAGVRLDDHAVDPTVVQPDAPTLAVQTPVVEPDAPEQAPDAPPPSPAPVADNPI